MLDKLYSWMEKRRYNSFLLRLVVGVYLFYLAVQLFRGTVGADASRALTLGLGAVFLVIGGALAAVSLIAILNGHYAEHVHYEKLEQEKTVNEQTQEE